MKYKYLLFINPLPLMLFKRNIQLTFLDNQAIIYSIYNEKKNFNYKHVKQNKKYILKQKNYS